MQNALPDVKFYRVIPTARLPMRADRSALGTMPTRAFRYCDALTSASAFGYYAFAPMELTLLWRGDEIFWRYPGIDEWLPLAAAQYPDLSTIFDAAAPPELRGCAPPMLTKAPEPGVLQIWTGLFARVAPGWSLLVRPPANLPPQGGYAAYEGIVEADRWFGPLFTNIRLTRTDSPISLRSDYPLIQVQAIPRSVYADDAVADVTVCPDLTSFSAEDWDDYNTSIAEPSSRPNRPFGSYAVEARKARKAAGCPA